MRTRSRQHGWGLLVTLAALVIVALLARDALVRYFHVVTGATPVAATPGPPKVRDSPASQAVPAAPADRAAIVEDIVRKQREETSRRIDAGSRL